MWEAALRCLLRCLLPLRSMLLLRCDCSALSSDERKGSATRRMRRRGGAADGWRTRLVWLRSAAQSPLASRSTANSAHTRCRCCGVVAGRVSSAPSCSQPAAAAAAAACRLRCLEGSIGHSVYATQDVALQQLHVCTASAQCGGAARMARLLSTPRRDAPMHRSSLTQPPCAAASNTAPRRAQQQRQPSIGWSAASIRSSSGRQSTRRPLASRPASSGTRPVAQPFEARRVVWRVIAFLPRRSAASLFTSGE